MKSGFYMYLSSADSSTTHPSNVWHDFICEFNPEIVLENNCPHGLRPHSWSVALLELSLLDQSKPVLSLPESIVVLSDLVSESYIKARRLSILRTLTGGSEVGATLAQPYYIDVDRVNFNSIHISILQRELTTLTPQIGWPVDDKKAVLRCTLHFQRT